MLDGCRERVVGMMTGRMVSYGAVLRDNGGGIFCNTVEARQDDGDDVMDAWEDNCDDVLEKGGCLKR